MSIKQTLFSTAAKFFFERPGKKKSYQQLAEELTESGKKLSQKFAAGTDNEANRKQAQHIIGIERWGQRRLQVALGEPLVEDEYMGYQPAAELTMPQMQTEFDSTRQTTVEIARQLDEQGISTETTVKHNDFGLMTTRGWLQYLKSHADFEGKRLK